MKKMGEDEVKDMERGDNLGGDHGFEGRFRRFCRHRGRKTWENDTGIK